MMRRLDPSHCLVIVVDIQERLSAAMPPSRMDELIRATTVLVEAARLLGGAAIATEQYPAGLGSTLPAISQVLTAAGSSIIDKLHFGACDEPRFARALAAKAPRHAVVVGMETHVCVYQTVRELCARGLDVHVPLDGVASRRDDHRIAGLDLCRACGATITTMETVVFDWLGRAGTDDFKALSKRIR